MQAWFLSGFPASRKGAGPLPTVLWRGWSHGTERFDLSACCLEACRSSHLRYG
jgi:hypothetical protein